MEGILQYYKDCLKVKGRLGRMAYFKANLALLGLFLVFIIVAIGSFFVVMLISNLIGSKLLPIIVGIAGAISYVVFLLFLVAAEVALGIRRLHDVNLSGWWIIGIALIQSALNVIVSMFSDGSLPSYMMWLGWLIVLAYFLVPGTQAKNDYETIDEHPSFHWIFIIIVIQTLLFAAMVIPASVKSSTEGVGEIIMGLNIADSIIALVIMGAYFLLYGTSKKTKPKEIISSSEEQMSVEKHDAQKSIVAKKAVSKKAPAKKPATKKVPTKKTTVKKAAAKKPAAKKTTTKKPAVKKAPAKKKTTTKAKGSKE